MNSEAPGVRRVLYVENRALDAELLQIAVEQLERPFGLTVAPGGEAALSRLGEETFDLVLLALNTVDLPWQNVLRELRRVAPDTPVVALSGNRIAALVEEALRLGVAEYIDKPETFEECDRLARHIERRLQPTGPSDASARS